MKIESVGYMYGRVIRNDCSLVTNFITRSWPRISGFYLVYVYKDITTTMEPDQRLSPTSLLIAPVKVYGAGWSLGYFQPLRVSPLRDEDVLPTHCFEVGSGMRQLNSASPVIYVDEYGSTLPRRVEPCGCENIGEYGSLERAVAEALCLPDPDTVPPLVERLRIAAGGDALADSPRAIGAPPRPMALGPFWDLIDSARRSAGSDKERMLESLRRRLMRLPPSRVAAFAQRLSDLVAKAYTWDLWGAAYLMNGGCSDSGFEHWRAWLVAQGRAVFEAALKDPQSLAAARLKFGEDGDYEFESLLDLPDEVYEELTGAGLGLAPRQASGKPSGKRWVEAELARRFPALSRKFTH